MLLLEKEENEIDSIQKEKEILLEELIQILEEEKNQDHILSSIINCRKILEIAEDLNNEELYDKYINSIVRFEQKLEDIHQIEEEEYKLVQKQIQDLSKIINVEDSIMPEIEDIPIENLVKNFNSDLNDMKDLATRVLNEHSVEIKEVIHNRMIIKRSSGKSIENQKDIDISVDFSSINNKNNDILNPEYYISNIVDNESDDPIEEALIQDIIPYNYEITEVTINGKEPELQPDTKLKKNGLQYSWYIPKMDENDSINFKYQLKPRISRTIILPLKNSVKVIKTHSDLKDETEQNIEVQNSEVALLTFKNSFENRLNNIVFEDIIPIFYAYEVEEHKSQHFPSFKESSENFVKWKLNEMPIEQSSQYEYELTELHKIEELKIKAYNLLKINPKEYPILKRGYLKKQQERAKLFLKKYNFNFQ